MEMIAPQIKVGSWFYLVPRPIDGFPETAYPRFYMVVERDKDSVGMREFAVEAKRLENTKTNEYAFSPIETKYHSFDKYTSTYVLEPSGVIRVESGVIKPYNRNRKIIVAVPTKRWCPENPEKQHGYKKQHPACCVDYLIHFVPHSTDISDPTIACLPSMQHAGRMCNTA